jgi:hypothetical protein
MRTKKSDMELESGSIIFNKKLMFLGSISAYANEIRATIVAICKKGIVAKA